MKRVLKKNCKIILVENHWESEFLRVLGEKLEYNKSKIQKIQSIEKFEVVKQINSPLKFKSKNEAKEILSKAIRVSNNNYFANKKSSTIGHKIVILAHKNVK